MRFLCFTTFLAAVLVRTAPLLFAQVDTGNPIPIDYTTARFERVAKASALSETEKILIDGRLTEDVWRKAQPATDFIQWDPNPGAPATEKTEVRFLYDADNLYIGARCFDSAPDRLVANDMNREIFGGNEDGLAIVFDTFHDQRSGFFFGTNPAGGRRDSQVANDGATENKDWEGVWEVKVTRDEEGWTAEFVIPFKTLRFSNSPSQIWGLNILRRVRRKNEDSQWSPLPRRFRTTHVSLAGTLIGLEKINQGRNLKIKPYVTGGITQAQSSSVLKTEKHRDGGVDLKYGLTQSLTLDLTYRTDFSQVEVDQQQVNLSRFSIFFPEKREFFLENSGIFSVAGTNNNSNLIPFFSRRIGLSLSGEPIPIGGGARISGKAGAYDVGVLTMKTRSAPGESSNNFAVGRVKRNLLRNSYVGTMIMHRDSTLVGDFNDVYGIDTNLRFFDKLEVSSYILASKTPRKSGNNYARLLEAGWLDNDLTVRGHYDQVQSNFTPEIGFVRRANVDHYNGNLSWYPRFEGNRRFKNLILSSDADYYSGSGSGKVETRNQDFTTGVAFQGGGSVNLIVSQTFDRLIKPFNIRPSIGIPIGDYNYTRYAITSNSNPSRAISGNANFNWGGFWDGKQTSAAGGLSLKPSYHLNIELTYSGNRVTLPHSSFTTNLVGTKFFYAFSPKMSFHAFLQYNAETHQFISNVRFNIIHRPLSDLFIVYNDRRDTVTNQIIDRGVLVKLTNLFNF